MAMFQGLFLLVMGVLLSAFLYQSHTRGWLPFGSNGFKGRVEIQKIDNPIGFWIVFILYSVGALSIIIYSLLILGHIAPPLPLRSNH